MTTARVPVGASVHAARERSRKPRRARLASDPLYARLVRAIADLDRGLVAIDEIRKVALAVRARRQRGSSGTQGVTDERRRLATP